MALVLADRVQETCTSPGTGAVSLLGAVTGYQTFSSAIGNANTCYYCIADQGGANWEVGIGTYSSTGNTLTRTTPLSGSAATPVNFSSGTQTVFVTYPAEKSINLDASGNSTALGTPVSVNLANGTGLPLTTGVSGVLPTANGGTNLSSFTSGGAVYATSTSALTTGTLPITAGGTGQTTAGAAFNALSPITTTGDLIIGNGTNSATRLAIGTNGYILQSNGTTASWQPAPASGLTQAQTTALVMTLGF